MQHINIGIFTSVKAAQQMTAGSRLESRKTGEDTPHTQVPMTQVLMHAHTAVQGSGSSWTFYDFFFNVPGVTVNKWVEFTQYNIYFSLTNILMKISNDLHG